MSGPVVTDLVPLSAPIETALSTDGVSPDDCVKLPQEMGASAVAQIAAAHKAGLFRTTASEIQDDFRKERRRLMRRIMEDHARAIGLLRAK